MARLKRFTQFVNEDHDGGETNYMFFGNLEQIKRQIDELLQMDHEKVDALLNSGHNWAADHIATSKDDIEEVYNFMMGEAGEESNLPAVIDEPSEIGGKFLTKQHLAKYREEMDNEDL